MRRLLFVLLFSAVAWGQGQDVCPSCTVLGGHLVAGGNVILGNFGASTGSYSTTIYEGMPGATLDNNNDNGNALDMYWESFTTPANMTNPAWGTPQMFWQTPDSSTPNWGEALYADASCYGTVTTSGATVTWVSGSSPSGCQFKTTYWGNGVGLFLCPTATTCAIYYVSSVGSATSLTLTATPSTGCASACPFQVSTPAAPLCTSFTSSVASAGWNAAPSWSCSNTPASSTRYWLSFVTPSATQGMNNSNMPCEFTNGSQVWPNVGGVGSFTSNASWPANMLSTSLILTGYTDQGDGCIGAYIPLTYTTTNRYSIVTSAPLICDLNGATCHVFIPPVPSNATVIAVNQGQGTYTANGGAGDFISGTATDTLTLRGTFTNPGGGANYSFYEIDRATAGVNEVSCTITGWTSGSNKSACWVVVVTGTQSTSFDKVFYDSTTLSLTGNTFTGGSTATTSAANEIAFGAVINGNSQSCCIYAGNFLVPNGGAWNLLGVSAFTNSSSIPFSLFYEVLSSTQTVNVLGKVLGPLGSPAISTGDLTLQ